MIVYRGFSSFTLQMECSEYKSKNIFDRAFLLKYQKFGVDWKRMSLHLCHSLVLSPIHEIRRERNSHSSLEKTEKNHLCKYFLYHRLQQQTLRIDEEKRGEYELIPVLLSFAIRIEC